MALKFQRDDFLDKKFEEFAFLPNEDDLEKQKKHEADIERFLNPKPKEEKKEKK